MICPKRMYRLDIINKYITELIHINNFNKYKNELIRSFYNCDNICENCDEYICNKINKEFIQYEILHENQLCNGCEKYYCEDCQELIYECNECGDIGMFEEDLIYFDGIIIFFCYGCDRDICDNCSDDLECNKCGCKYCIECLDNNGICIDCLIKLNCN